MPECKFAQTADKMEKRREKISLLSLYFIKIFLSMLWIVFFYLLFSLSFLQLKIDGFLFVMKTTSQLNSILSSLSLVWSFYSHLILLHGGTAKRKKIQKTQIGKNQSRASCMGISITRRSSAASKTSSPCSPVHLVEEIWTFVRSREVNAFRDREIEEIRYNLPVCVCVLVYGRVQWTCAVCCLICRGLSRDEAVRRLILTVFFSLSIWRQFWSVILSSAALLSLWNVLPLPEGGVDWDHDTQW